MSQLLEEMPVAAPPTLSHLRLLEAESIHILRKIAGPIPFPLLHIDTGYKFREMLEFRDSLARSLGVELLVWRNEDALAAGANPVALDTKRCCGLLKTQALFDGLRHHGFTAAFGGARRDEKKSRAKERIYSFRDRAGQ